MVLPVSPTALRANRSEPVRRIMDSWIFQGGFPLLSVTEEADSISLSQERMRYAGSDESPDQIGVRALHGQAHLVTAGQKATEPAPAEL